MVDNVQANKVYQAALQIQQLSKSLAQQANHVEGAKVAGGVAFQELVKRKVDTVRKSVDESEKQSTLLLLDSPDANPVAAAMATQEASHNVELASETLQRLVKMFDEMLKIAL